jgi:hypothetical protein
MSSTQQSIVDVRSRWFDTFETERRDFSQSLRLLMYAHNHFTSIFPAKGKGIAHSCSS